MSELKFSDLGDVLFNRKHTSESIEEDELQAIHQSIVHDYELDTPNSARAVREAAENGLAVVYPEANQLQIDIDSNRALEKYFLIIDVKITTSRSGLPKRHVTVTLDQPINNYQRIALQTIMGSDRVREFLGYVQEMHGDPTPILFLEPQA